jgi:hypothetical protein
LYKCDYGFARGPGCADVRRRILDQISLLADHEFAGRVQRPFMTAMYTGRRPDRNA